MTRVTTHPGEVLREEFMFPHGLSAEQLAKEIDVPIDEIESIISPESPSSVTLDMARKLSSRFDTTTDLWMNLQRKYDLSVE